jgi:hypothetical protein
MEPNTEPAGIRQQYHLNAVYDHARRALSVSEQIHYTNNTPIDLAEIILVVEPHRYPGVFQLERLGGPVNAYTLNSNRLDVTLTEPLSVGSQVTLEIDYQLALPPIPEPSDEYKPVPFGYTLRQTNLVDWYPFIPPYQDGVGWLAHDPWFFGEHQVYESSDFEIEFQAGGSDEPLVLAASSMPVRQEGDETLYRLDRARNFVLSISPFYQVTTEQVGETTVMSYGLPYFEEGARAALEYTVEALALYNDLFGTYPRASLSVVVADFLDGMEYSGLYFLSRGFFNTYDGTPAGYLAIIAVHETAHQWWYEAVGNDQALEPWLDEALCTYTERLYYEFNRPELADWWWAFRVDFYEPAGPVGGSIYDYTGFRPYRDAVYLRGAQFLEALRQRVGDEAFFAFLRDYYTRSAGELVTSGDFFAILSEHSSAQIDDLREAFFGP